MTAQMFVTSQTFVSRSPEEENFWFFRPKIGELEEERHASDMVSEIT